MQPYSSTCMAMQSSTLSSSAKTRDFCPSCSKQRRSTHRNDASARRGARKSKGEGWTGCVALPIPSPQTSMCRELRAAPNHRNASTTGLMGRVAPVRPASTPVRNTGSAASSTTACISARPRKSQESNTLPNEAFTRRRLPIPDAGGDDRGRRMQACQESGILRCRSPGNTRSTRVAESCQAPPKHRALGWARLSPRSPAGSSGVNWMHLFQCSVDRRTTLPRSIRIWCDDCQRVEL
jgi:hypothetical protein